MSEYPAVRGYTVEEVIGSGSFSTVFRATHNLTGTKVAIKQIPKANLEDSKRYFDFKREISILSRLDHPYIASLFEVVEMETAYFIVMEFVENESLLKLINTSGSLSELQAKRIFCQLISAVEYLHRELRVVHRDIKAENVLIDRFNNIRLVDFGLSNIITDSQPLLHTSSGSLEYASPEVIQGLPHSESTDIWSLGVLLYAIVSGYLPFESKSTSQQLQLIINSELKYPSQMTPPLVDLLKKMLAKKPEDRIQIEKISEHPWISPKIMLQAAGEGVEPGTRMTVVPMGAIDVDIVKQMTVHGLSTKGLVKMFQSGETREEVTAYKIMRKFKIADDIHALQLVSRASSWRYSLPFSANSLISLPSLEVGSGNVSDSKLLSSPNFNISECIIDHKHSQSTDIHPLRISSLPDSLLTGSPIIVKRRLRTFTHGGPEIAKPAFTRAFERNA